MSEKIALFEFGQRIPSQPSWLVKKSVAHSLVERGIAEQVSHNRIRFLGPNPSFDPLSNRRQDQGKAIEQAGIFNQRRFFQGGLTRDEHRPAPIPKCKGARVGHGN